MIKNNKYLEMILKEMCQRVGAKYAEIDFKSNHWYLKYNWTSKQQNDFGIWLLGALIKDKAMQKALYGYSAGKDINRKRVDMFLFLCGWTLKDA
jgi:hypothetical protein